MDQVLRMERFGRAAGIQTMSRLEDPLSRWLTSIDIVREFRLRRIAPARPLPKLSALEEGQVHVPIDEVVRQFEEMKQWGEGTDAGQ